MNAMEDDNKLFLGIGVVIGIIFGALILLFLLLLHMMRQKKNQTTPRETLKFYAGP